MPTPLTGRYINLDRSPDRAAWMQEQLARLGMDWVRRHAAVDGAQLAVPAGCSLLPGEYAIFQSHLQAMQDAPADAHTLILEDDTELSPQLPQILAQALQQGLKEVDVLVLECQPHFSLAHLSALWNSTHRFLETGADGVRRISGVDLLDAGQFYKWSCAAYLLTPAGRDKLVALVQGWLRDGPALPLDRLVERAFVSRELRGLLTVPFLATTGLQWHRHSTVGNGIRVPVDAFMVLRRLLYAGPLGEAQEMARAMQPLSPQDPGLVMFGKVLQEVAGLQRAEAQQAARAAQAAAR